MSGDFEDRYTVDSAWLPDSDPVCTIRTGHEGFQIIPAHKARRFLIDLLRHCLQNTDRNVPRKTCKTKSVTKSSKNYDKKSLNTSDFVRLRSNGHSIA